MPTLARPDRRGDALTAAQTPGLDAAEEFWAEAGHPRLLFVLPWSITAIGGVNEVVRNLIARASASGRWRPLLLESDYSSMRPRFETAAGLETVWMRLMAPWLPGDGWRSLLATLVVWPRNLLRLRGLFDRVRPACVNVHYPGPATLTVLLAARLCRHRIRVVLSFHGSDLYSLTSRSFGHRGLLRLALRMADGVVCCSESLGAQLRAAAPAVPCCHYVVHNGVDVDQILALSRGGDLPSVLRGIEYIVTVGTFEEKKGHDLLIRAFVKVRGRFPSLHLVVVGRDGPFRKRLEQVREELQLDACVIFLTDLPHGDALRAMAHARAFVLSSRREPFGIVLLEASILGLPIVATRVGGVAEIVEDRRSGRIVPAEDPSALAEAIVEVLGAPEQAVQLGQAAAERVRARFTWHQAFAAYEKIYAPPRTPQAP